MNQRERFSALVRAPRVPLGEGCCVIASHLGHPADPSAGMAALDELATSTGEAVDGRSGRRLEGISAHLFGSVGLRGDREHYYDARNSMLPDVLRRRRGIPITLAVVVIDVAERLGVPATGVGMPGHFLVGDGPAPTRWLDGFDGGTWLDADGAVACFRSIHGAGATFDASFLAPTPRPQILARVLANLAGIYRTAGDPTSLLRALELRCDIPGVGTAPRAQVELAEAHVAVGRTDEALLVLERLLERVDPRRRTALEERIAGLRAVRN
ncbi:transglutaminase family protein [Aquihabitans sp. McL0605]|uniref:transglutaminase family protein n=1 Tax=Aquihabitans sp. McL0605 TaxID=3415671 RepID=UPI003CE7C61A